MGAEPLDLGGHRSGLKRLALRLAGPLALGVGRRLGPPQLRTALLHRIAMPHYQATAVDFERAVDDGVFVGNTYDLLSLYVYVFGVWEPNLTRFMRSRLRPGDLFVDVGANTGWFTVLGAHRVGPAGTVVAVEASPSTAATLRRQVEVNQLTNVRVVEQAVSDHEGRVRLEPGPSTHSGVTRALVETTDLDSVVCRPLPSMRPAAEWARARLIKIDVEGAEFAAVRGMRDALGALPEDAELVVEVGAERTSRSEVEELFQVMGSAGFSSYALPNSYEVRDYVEAAPPDTLSKVTAASVTTMTDVVFSRRGGDQLELA